MENVTLAKTAGFCFGVTKAVDKVYELAKKSDKPIYTYGPIIHNEEVVKDLESKGVFVVDIEKARSLEKGTTIVIRSHGISKEEEDELNKLGLDVVDATCPFVKRIHDIANDAACSGETVIIVGDKEHPEVKGIRSRSGDDVYVIDSEEHSNILPQLNKVKIVSQTTFDNEKFQKIVEKIRLKCYYDTVINTICNATKERQIEALSLAKINDAMIVIGGKNSSNTEKLYQICKKVCKNTFFVQTVADLEHIDFPKVQSVGITAGASTPGNIIQEVLSYVRTKL